MTLQTFKSSILKILRPAIATLPASALILAMCATDVHALSQTKKDIQELQRNFFILQSDVADLKAKLDKSPSDDDFRQMRRAQADILTQVQDLLREVQVLTGRFEESRFFTDKLMNETSAKMEVLETRVETVTGGLSKKDIEEILTRLDGIEAGMKSMEDRLAALEEAAKMPPPEAQKKPEAKPKTPEEVYEEALAVFKQNDYEDARGMMEDFIKEFPEHKLAGNAQFWVADSYYAQKEYADAILAYEDLLQKYKGHSKIPAALLKQALAFIEIGGADNVKAARGILRELVANHPESEQAKTAQEKLDKLEGKEALPAKETEPEAVAPAKPTAAPEPEGPPPPTPEESAQPTESQ
jgi:tol-pal system protein YbgF